VSRSRSWLAILLVGAAVIVAWVATKKAAPPEVEFVKVTRETLVSSLSTNGKVEPIEWMPVRSERSGVITRVLVSRGQQVRKDDPLVELDTRVASADLSKAEAAIQEAKAQEQILTQGGRVAERQQIESDLARARLDLGAAQKSYQALDRLVAKQAATRQELDSARQIVDQLQLRIQSLEKSKAALVTGIDKEIAKARLQGALSAAAVAQSNLDLSIIRARVTVYVDEPDLGKVHEGELVIITWDALPGHQWKGKVDKLPTQIVPLGTRQVGEVGCIIENPDRDLLPNANINADIQATVVESALAIPKEAIRRQGSDTGVLLLQGDRVVWRKVNLGISSYTKSQVLSGLTDGDAGALPSEKPIQNGSRVQPIFQ
jgi:HlyD family secretion protein